ncbi:MAG: hypothetical protein KJ057_13100 [Phycisphaerae bacterium]|nr:hypothetical protein [Planctomycetia bacterium]MCL4719402.1 hypothetical protein [Phycisphaerae bacterium]
MKQPNCKKEDRAVEALIVAALMDQHADPAGLDLPTDEAELSPTDRAQLDSLSSDFVQQILEGCWVGCVAKGNDDSSAGDECVTERVTS